MIQQPFDTSFGKIKHTRRSFIHKDTDSAFIPLITNNNNNVTGVYVLYVTQPTHLPIYFGLLVYRGQFIREFEFSSAKVFIGC